MGQGTNTVFAQITADALGLDCEQIEILQPDTSLVPNSGPTVASRTTMIVGKLVETAALVVRKSLMDAGFLKQGYGANDFASACRQYTDKFGALQSLVKYQHPGDLHWDDVKYQGDAYGAYAWAVYFAEVSADMRMADVRAAGFLAMREVGRVVYAVLAFAQIAISVSCLRASRRAH